MASSEAMYSKALLDVDSQRRTSSNIFKVGIALIGGTCLVILGVVVMSTSDSTLRNTGEAESTSLFGMPTSLRSTPMAVRNLPGASPWKELTLAGLEASNRCDRDFSVNANRFKDMVSSLSSKDKAVVMAAEQAVAVSAKDVLKAGQVAPLGFFDPMGLSTNLDQGKLLFYREAEIKHGRVCMLATLGMLVGEKFHPFIGNNIDIASTKVFTQAPLDVFWPACFLQFMVAAGYEEFRTTGPVIQGRAFGGANPGNEYEEGFAAQTDRIPGDLGFDPLGLKPKNEKDLLTIQNKEILNGRLAMIAVAGIVAQEMVTGQKIF